MRSMLTENPSAKNSVKAARTIATRLPSALAPDGTGRPVDATGFTAKPLPSPNCTTEYTFQAPAEEFGRLIPHSRVELVPDCGHIPEVEHTGHTYTTVTEFLAAQ